MPDDTCPEPFTMVPNAMLGTVSRGAIATYVALRSHQNQKTGRCAVRDAVVGELIGCTERQVRRDRVELREAGFLSWVTTRGASIYSFSSPDTDAHPSPEARTQMSTQPGHPCPRSPDTDVLRNKTDHEQDEERTRAPSPHDELTAARRTSAAWIQRSRDEWPATFDTLVAEHGAPRVLAVVQQLAADPPSLQWPSQARKHILNHLQHIRLHCPTCGGRGHTYNDIDDTGTVIPTPCTQCGGADHG